MSEVNMASLRQRFGNAWDVLDEGAQREGLGSGGIDWRDEPPHDSGMEKLIERVDHLEARFDRLDERVRDVQVEVAKLSGKLDLLVAKIPSWWQAPVGAGGLIALMAALIGLAKALHWF